MGRLSEADEELQAALRLMPNDPLVLNNLGIALAAEGRLPEAMGQLQHALEQKPDYAEGHNSLGIVLCAAAKWGRQLTNFDGL